MNPIFNEDDVRKTYHLLAHEHETEVRLIDPRKKSPPKSIFVHTEEEFVEACRKHNGEYNIYAGINERTAGGTKKTDVLNVKTVVVDIDSNHPKDQAATQDEMDKARDTLNEILKSLDQDEFKPSGVMMSGNGYQIWFSIPSIKISDTNREEIEGKLKKLQGWFKTFEGKNATIDNIGDLPRIIKVAGTMSVKGDNTSERPWRCACWEQYAPSPSANLRDKVLMLSPDTPQTQTGDGVKKEYDKKKRDKLLESDLKMLRLYEGEVEQWGYKSRSEAEFALILMLFRGGLTKEEVWGAMDDARTGKWAAAGDEYKRYTLDKAEKYTKKSKQNELDTPAYNDDITQTFPSLFQLQKKKALSRLAEHIREKYHVKTVIETEPKPVLYRWNGGHYVPNAEGEIFQEARNIGMEHLTRADLGEVLSYVKTSSYVSEQEFDTELSVLSVKNGMLDINDKLLLEHDPDYLIRVQLNTIYDPTAKCPRWEKFLEEVIVPKGEEPDEEHLAKIATLQEVAGYCLYRANPIHKAVMLTGEGKNGKSVFLETLIALFGTENVSTVPLQAFDSREYSLGAMVGKLANIHADLSDKAMTESGNFKMVVGGDRVYVNRKYKDPVSSNIYAKLLFSANKVPETRDHTPAFFRRWIIIHFPNHFEGESDDKQLKTKLREELPGILNWALEGLERLLHNQEFTYSPTVEEMELLYLTLSSPVDAFVMDCLEKEGAAVVTKNEMYQLFVAYAKKKKLPILTDNAFARKFKTAAAGVEEQRRTLDKKDGRVTCWVGWKPTTEENDQGCQGCQSNLQHTSYNSLLEQHKENNPDIPDTFDTKSLDSEPTDEPEKPDIDEIEV